MHRHADGPDSSSAALKSGVGCITPGCRGETRRTAEFALFTVSAAAWHTCPAYRLRQETPMTWAWIASRLRTSRASYVSHLRAKIEQEAGEPAAARADLNEARRPNPQEECLREGFEGCG